MLLNATGSCLADGPWAKTPEWARGTWRWVCHSFWFEGTLLVVRRVSLSCDGRVQVDIACTAGGGRQRASRCDLFQIAHVRHVFNATFISSDTGRSCFFINPHLYHCVCVVPLWLSLPIWLAKSRRLKGGPADSRRFSEVSFGIQRGKPENVQKGCLLISIVFGFCSLLAFQKSRSDLGIF